MQRVLAALLVLLLAVSGCVGSEAGPGSTTTPIETEATVDAGTGGIEGMVTDDEVVPIAGADIAVLGAGDPVKTDASGKFAFSKLEPAEYNVAVSRLGYFSKSATAVVKPGEVTRVDVVLQRIPIAEDGFDEVVKFSDTLPVSDACAAREAYDQDQIDEWPESTRGVTWQKYPVLVNATKPDGTDLLAIRMKIDLIHQTSDATIDIDMRLVDAAGKVLANGWTDAADEFIDHQKTLTPGPYEVYVCYWAGAQAEYKITVTTSYEQGDRAKYFRENPKEIEYPEEPET